MAIGVQTDMATPALARFGSDELRREFLAPAISGEMVACIGVSEPGAGSDVAAIKTSARSDGDDYVIDGGKMWITNGAQADWICLLANTGDGAEASQQVADLRADEDQGRHRRAQTRQARHARLRHRADLLRRRARAQAQPDRRGGQGLHLSDDAVPGGAPVGRGRVPEGARIHHRRDDRLHPPAQGVRHSILDNQTVHFKLAELQTEVELLRSLVYRAAEAMIAGADMTQLATMAKLKAGQLGRELPSACLQYWGGMGFMNETPVSRAFRDGRLAVDRRRRRRGDADDPVQGHGDAAGDAVN